MRGTHKGSGQASGFDDAPKLSALAGVQETSPDVVTYMLNVFSIYLYFLLSTGTTLYFVTPLIAMKFNIIPDMLN